MERKELFIVFVISCYVGYALPSYGYRQQGGAFSKRESEKTKALNRRMQALEKQANETEARGEYRAAEAIVEQEVALRPYWPVAYLRLGRLYDKEGRSAEAYKAYRIGIESPGMSLLSPKVMTRFGDLSMSYGTQSEARKAYALALGPNKMIFGSAVSPQIDATTDTSTLKGLAYASLASGGGWLQQRLKYASEAYRSAPNSTFVCFVCGDLMYQLQRQADARIFFEKGVGRLSKAKQADAEGIVEKFGLGLTSEVKQVTPDGKLTIKRFQRKFSNRPLRLAPNQAAHWDKSLGVILHP